MDELDDHRIPGKSYSLALSQAYEMVAYDIDKRREALDIFEQIKIEDMSKDNLVKYFYGWTNGFTAFVNWNAEQFLKEKNGEMG